MQDDVDIHKIQRMAVLILSYHDGDRLAEQFSMEIGSAFQFAIKNFVGDNLALALKCLISVLKLHGRILKLQGVLREVQRAMVQTTHSFETLSLFYMAYVLITYSTSNDWLSKCLVAINKEENLSRKVSVVKAICALETHDDLKVDGEVRSCLLDNAIFCFRNSHRRFSRTMSLDSIILIVSRYSGCLTNGGMARVKSIIWDGVYDQVDVAIELFRVFCKSDQCPASLLDEVSLMEPSLKAKYKLLTILLRESSCGVAVAYTEVLGWFQNLLNNEISAAVADTIMAYAEIATTEGERFMQVVDEVTRNLQCADMQVRAANEVFLLRRLLKFNLRAASDRILSRLNPQDAYFHEAQILLAKNVSTLCPSYRFDNDICIQHLESPDAKLRLGALEYLVSSKVVNSYSDVTNWIVCAKASFSGDSLQERCLFVDLSRKFINKMHQTLHTEKDHDWKSFVRESLVMIRDNLALPGANHARLDVTFQLLTAFVDHDDSVLQSTSLVDCLKDLLQSDTAECRHGAYLMLMRCLENASKPMFHDRCSYKEHFLAAMLNSNIHKDSEIDHWVMVAILKAHAVKSLPDLMRLNQAHCMSDYLELEKLDMQLVLARKLAELLSLDLESKYVDIAIVASLRVLPTLSAPAPEGSFHGNHDDIIESQQSSYALHFHWRIIKEVGAIFEILIQNTSCFYPVIEKVGNHLRHLLTKIRHRGAFSALKDPLEGVCKLLFCHSRQDICRSWAEDDLSLLEDDAHATSITRRSAGIPFVVSATLNAEIEHAKSMGVSETPSSLLNFNIEGLLKIISSPLSFDELARDRTDLLQVHAINVLRHICMEHRIWPEMTIWRLGLFETCFRLLDSRSWAIRNSATMLFASLMKRLQENTHISKSKVSFRTFFNATTSSFGSVVKSLEMCVLQRSTSVFAQLRLLVTLSYSAFWPEASDLVVMLIHVTQSICVTNSCFKIRSIAAELAAKLITTQRDVETHIKKMYDLILCTASSNGVHGLCETLDQITHYSSVGINMKKVISLRKALSLKKSLLTLHPLAIEAYLRVVLKGAPNADSILILEQLLENDYLMCCPCLADTVCTFFLSAALVDTSDFLSRIRVLMSHSSRTVRAASLCGILRAMKRIPKNIHLDILNLIKDELLNPVDEKISEYCWKIVCVLQDSQPDCFDLKDSFANLDVPFLTLSWKIEACAKYLHCLPSMEFALNVSMRFTHEDQPLVLRKAALKLFISISKNHHFTELTFLVDMYVVASRLLQDDDQEIRKSMVLFLDISTNKICMQLEILIRTYLELVSTEKSTLFLKEIAIRCGREMPGAYDGKVLFEKEPRNLFRERECERRVIMSLLDGEVKERSK